MKNDPVKSRHRKKSLKRVALTKKQHALQEEVLHLLKWLRITPDLTEIDSALRTSCLTWAKRELIISGILQEYLLMDEHLNNEMCREFFPRRTYAALWKTKRFRAFNHNILDRLPLLQKLEFVRTRIRLPDGFYDRIRGLNSLRNAVAHSFFPENRRTKPKWQGSDIFALAGYAQFFQDMFEVSQFFFARFHRQERRRRANNPRRC